MKNSDARRNIDTPRRKSSTGFRKSTPVRRNYDSVRRNFDTPRRKSSTGFRKSTPVRRNYDSVRKKQAIKFMRTEAVFMNINSSYINVLALFIFQDRLFAHAIQLKYNKTAM
jgi:hypothetical protein